MSVLGAKGRLARGAVLACAAGMVLAGLSGCGEEKLRQEMAREMEEATDGSVVEFKLPKRGQPNWVWLAPPEGEEAMSSADMAAAIAVVDSHRSDSRLAEGGPLSLTIGDERGVLHPLVFAEWSDTADGNRVLTSIASNDPNAGLSAREFRMAYGDWMCQLPRLEEMSATGPGSDFSRAGECSPNLRRLVIGAWDDSSGYEGLGDLGSLMWLTIGGSVDVRDFPAIDGLKGLDVHLAQDTEANRAALEAKLPGCDVTFRDTPELS